jgi:hypothetical protein
VASGQVARHALEWRREERCISPEWFDDFEAAALRPLSRLRSFREYWMQKHQSK